MGLFLLIFTFISPQVHAKPAAGNSDQNAANNICINNTSAKNDKLLESFRDNNDPLKLAFLDSRRAANVPACDLTLNEKDLGFMGNLSRMITSTLFPEVEFPLQDTKADLLELSKKVESKSPQISRECIEASMKRAPGNDGYSCRYPTVREAQHGFDPNKQSIANKYGKAGGNTLQCVNNEMVDYMHFAVNNAIDCMSPGRPIDSRAIFQKLNNETGFNPSIAYPGGIGIGQITTSAIRELTTDAGKGQHIFEDIVSSKKESCQSFKSIAKKDLQSYPPVRNRCSYNSMGDGLARSLMYAIGYYITMRDDYLIPALDTRSSKMVSNDELVSKLAAIAYGGEGIKHAKWLVQKYRVNERTDTKAFIKTLHNESTYLKQTAGKMRETLCLQKGVDPSSTECRHLQFTPEELGADTCVSQ
ncbi:hypothetical protein [Bdellovibrio sp. HCB337]|uniref:hypothetical protein n=1 Tax=Bdellovibrio sp. HCB337 TaxID=3394358 RepID=UPI0039A5A2F5